MEQIHIILAGICTLMYGVIMLCLFSVHVVTTYLAWQISGLLPAIITFFTPPFAELWWAFSAWMETGVFFNLFTLMICGVIALYIIQVVFAVLLALTAPKSA